MNLPHPTTELETWFGEHYQSLYRYALNLSRNHHDACDLAQQTFYIVQIKRVQLRDVRRIKSWLAVTLQRLLLQRRRHECRFPKCDIAKVEHELPAVGANHGATMDAETVRTALATLGEHFRRPLALFYLEDRSYQEIATALALPMGTVMSRLARGKQLLRQKLERGPRFPVARSGGQRGHGFARASVPAPDLAFSTQPTLRR